jgi:hypothetical protein
VARQIADQLALFPAADLAPFHREALLNALSRITQPADNPIWPGGYVMLSKMQIAVIWDAIRKLPRKSRPAQVRHAFDLVLLNLRTDTGEVTLTRDEMAEAMGTSADHVSEVMGTLKRMGVVYCQRRPVPGMKGPGAVAYMVNANVAWNGSLETRQQKAMDHAAPSAHLSLVPQD